MMSGSWGGRSFVCVKDCASCVISVCCVFLWVAHNLVMIMISRFIQIIQTVWFDYNKFNKIQKLKIDNF